MPTPSSVVLRKALPWLVLVVGIAASVVIGLRIRAEITKDSLVTFNNEAEDVSSLITERLQTLGFVLRGAAATFLDPSKPRPEEWKAFAQQMQPQVTLPGVQGIGFVQAVPAQQLASHLASMQARGFSDYAITPAGEREFYAPVIFIEPLDNINRRAIGLDAYADQARRTALELATGTGLPMLTGKTTLPQDDADNKQPASFMLFPVYRENPGNGDAAARRNLVVGWTAIPLRMNDFINGILRGWRELWNDRIDLYIYDGDETNSEALLYTSAPFKDPQKSHGKPGHDVKQVQFNGSTWVLQFDFAPALANLDMTPAWMGFGIGLLITGLVIALINTLMSVQERSRKLALQLTAELRQQHEALLTSEYRWKFALEGAGDGVWDWNVETDHTFYSERCLAMLGYAPGEIAPSILEWRSRIHPDELEEVMAEVERCISGVSEIYDSQHRLRKKDGSYLWIHSRAMAVARDQNNRALRLLGTVSDISAQKRNEELLQQKQLELLEAQRIAKVGSWSLELATGLVSWSPELQHLMGDEPGNPVPPFPTQPSRFTPESWAQLEQAARITAEEGTPFEMEVEVIKPDGSHAHFLSHGEAERSPDGRIERIRGTAAEITSQVLATRHIERLSRLYATLSACNDAIVHCRSTEELLQSVCEIVVTNGKMAMAWVGLVDSASGKVIPHYKAGSGTDYLNDIDISIHADDPRGQGPTGTSIRENRSVWVENFSTNPQTRNWHQRASKFNWISSAALPLCRGGNPIGTLTFYSQIPDWFTPEIRALLEEMALNISYALDKLDTEKELQNYHRSLVEAEQRFRSLVEQAMVGAFIVQETKFVYVNPYMETLLGYPHDGSLYAVVPAGSIVSDRDHPAVQKMMDRLLAGEINNFEHTFGAVRRDGSTVDVAMTVSRSNYQNEFAIVGMMQDLSNRQVAEAVIKRYADTLEKVFLQTVGMITNLVEMRDPYTVGHEKHVADLAVAIGREMNLSPQQLEGLQVGGYLHDVGKVSVPSEILSKPGRITTIEYELIKGHPIAGYQILKDVEFPWPVAEIAYQHHERMDGSGYPRGLKGNEILLEARIVAVADVVESMHSHRPYRPGLGIDKALAEIEQGRGTRYDATVVDACVRLFREKGFSL